MGHVLVREWGVYMGHVLVREWGVYGACASAGVGCVYGACARARVGDCVERVLVCCVCVCDSRGSSRQW